MQRRTERLPLNFSQIDAAWLTRALQSQYPGSEVTHVDVVQEIPGHTSKARLKLVLNQTALDAGVPVNVCIKGNFTGDPLSSMVCANEARFYHLLRSQLRMQAPQCYFADWDDDDQSKQGIVLLEDLKTIEGEFGGSHNPIGADDMALSLEGLAQLHGGSWGLPLLNQQAWLQQAMAPETVWDDYWGMMEEIYARHNSLPERLAIFPQWMREDTYRLRLAFKQLCAHETAHTGKRCIVHGDAHLGNSFRKSNGERIWFDWQIVRKGLPWRDLTYFMIGSMTIDDRRKHERELLQHYLEHFIAHGGEAYSFDHVWNEYRRMVIWGIVAWQSNINPNEKTMGPLERFCRASDDLETESFYCFA